MHLNFAFFFLFNKKLQRQQNHKKIVASSGKLPKMLRQHGTLQLKSRDNDTIYKLLMIFVSMNMKCFIPVQLLTAFVWAIATWCSTTNHMSHSQLRKGQRWLQCLILREIRSKFAWEVCSNCHVQSCCLVYESVSSAYRRSATMIDCELKKSGNVRRRRLNASL